MKVKKPKAETSSSQEVSERCLTCRFVMGHSVALPKPEGVPPWRGSRRPWYLRKSSKEDGRSVPSVFHILRSGTLPGKVHLRYYYHYHRWRRGYSTPTPPGNPPHGGFPGTPLPPAPAAAPPSTPLPSAPAAVRRRPARLYETPLATHRDRLR